MNTREIAEEYRLSHWSEIMRERKESGMSIRAYCKQAGYHENVYYYWQKKLRAAACEQLRTAQHAKNGGALCTPGFTEVRLAEAGVSRPAMEAAEIRIEIIGAQITAGSGYPVEELGKLLRELIKPC